MEAATPLCSKVEQAMMEAFVVGVAQVKRAVMFTTAVIPPPGAFAAVFGRLCRLFGVICTWQSLVLHMQSEVEHL